MYQDKVEILRENELQRIVKRILSVRREDRKGIIMDLPYDKIPCDDAEKAELRAIAKESLLELEKAFPDLVAYNQYVRGKSWPENLYETIFDSTLERIGCTLSEMAEKALLKALKILPQKTQTCVLLFFKEKMMWDEICDKLDIYFTELDSIINRTIRHLRRSGILYNIALEGILVGQDEPLSDEKIAITRLNNAVAMACKKAWPHNLHALMINRTSIPFCKEVILNELAEVAILQALHALNPVAEQCMIKLFKEQKSWKTICGELDITPVELERHYTESIHSLRKAGLGHQLTQ